jgi:AAA domain
MTSFTFEPATKRGAKARIAIIGGPGSGKTWTALEVAQGLDIADGEHIGLVDTDRHSARKYADVFAFRTVAMSTFDPADLTRAAIAAADQRIGVLIVDTASPFWSGDGGMLDRVGQANTSFEGWRNMRPVERQMFDALLGFPGHVIVTLRTKVDYVIEQNDKGKMEPRRVGTKPEQRDGMEYEFDVVIDVDNAGASARVSKTRCPELANAYWSKPTREVGQQIQAWLDRDAVGEVLNPNTVREWALELRDGGEPARTTAELRERLAALEEAGQAEAVVYAPNGTDLMSIRDLLGWVGRAIRDRERRAARATAGAGA